MKKEKIEIINTVLKNSISKNEIKKIVRIKDWYRETEYSEEVYLPLTNYFENNKKPELGCFLFKYLLSNNSLRQLRSLIETDKDFQNYISNNSTSFLKYTIQFFSYSENWDEIAKKIIEIEKDKNICFFVKNANIMFNQYRPLESILGLFLKKEDPLYWFGNERQQYDLQDILLDIIENNETFKSNKNSVLSYVVTFAKSISENKKFYTLSEGFKSFLSLFEIIEGELSHSEKVKISENIDDEILKKFMKSLNNIEKNLHMVKEEITQIASLKEKKEIGVYIQESSTLTNRKRI